MDVIVCSATAHKLTTYRQIISLTEVYTLHVQLKVDYGNTFWYELRYIIREQHQNKAKHCYFS